jgi:hypothetical protein
VKTIRTRPGGGSTAFAPAPEIGREDVREVFLRTYRIVYQARETGVVVLTVFEGHRRFPREALSSEDEDV